MLKLFVKLPLVEVITTLPPCSVTFWLVAPSVRAAVGVKVFTANVPPTVTVLPDWDTRESPMVCVPVNTGSFPAVPPLVVTPPPAPAQLPTDVHIS